MKKILFATTALVASTTFAMADVDLSGSAEMGVFGGDEIEDQFHTDIDVTFSMSGETDTGLTFGASVDIDEGIGDNNADDGLGESGATRDDSDDGGATIFVSGAFGTLTMGDTDGAFDFAMTEAIIGSSLRDNHEHIGYSGNSGFDEIYDGQIVRYDYAFGDITVAASAEIDDDGDFDPAYGLGVTYNLTLGAIDVGLGMGYQSVNTTDSFDIIGISADFRMQNGLQAIVNYSDLDDSIGVPFDGTLAEDHFGIAVGYEFGALLVAANYGSYDLVGSGRDKGTGIIANYDLGGGASLQGGYAYNDPDFADSFDTYSLGIAMTF